MLDGRQKFAGDGRIVLDVDEVLKCPVFEPVGLPGEIDLDVRGHVLGSVAGRLGLLEAVPLSVELAVDLPHFHVIRTSLRHLLPVKCLLPLA